MQAEAPIAFLHLPRTGGGSLESALLDLHGGEAAFKIKTIVVDETLARTVPDTARIIFGHMNYGLHVHRPVRYATVLRDPVERIASHFRLREIQTRRHGQPVPSLQEFLEEPLWQNMVTGMLAGTYRAFMPSDWHLALAKRRLEQFAFVGFFDRLQMFASAIGARSRLPHVHRSADTPTLTGEALKTARRVNALDLELYDWARTRFAACSPIGLHGPDHVVRWSVPAGDPPLAILLQPLAAPGIEQALREAYGEQAIPVTPHEDTGPGVAALVDERTRVLFGELPYGVHRYCQVRYATILRDPVDRLLALLNWVSARTPEPRRRAAVDAFVASHTDSLVGQLAAGSRGDPLEAAKQRLSDFAFVGFSSAAPAPTASWPIPPLPPVEPVDPKPWTGRLTEIRRLNAKDIALYEWACERFAGKPA